MLRVCIIEISIEIVPVENPLLIKEVFALAAEVRAALEGVGAVLPGVLDEVRGASI